MKCNRCGDITPELSTMKEGEPWCCSCVNEEMTFEFMLSSEKKLPETGYLGKMIGLLNKVLQNHLDYCGKLGIAKKPLISYRYPSNGRSHGYVVIKAILRVKPISPSDTDTHQS